MSARRDTAGPSARRGARLAAVLGLLACAVVRTVAASEVTVPLYNALLYRDVPAFGTRQFVVYEQSFFGHGTAPDGRRPSDAGIAAAVANLERQRALDEPRWAARSPLVAIDIERWPLWPFVPLAEHALALADYADTARRFAAAADAPVCLYGVLPGGGIAVATRAANEPGFAAEWRAANALAARVLHGHVDALCPPFYSFYRGATAAEATLYLEQWKRSVSAHVALAHDVAPGLELRPFVWPRYHAGGGVEGHPPVDADTWRAELEHLDGLVDGLIVWGGIDLERGGQLPWDDDAPWWRVLDAR